VLSGGPVTSLDRAVIPGHSVLMTSMPAPPNPVKVKVSLPFVTGGGAA
jgi:hypothetical protein